MTPRGFFNYGGDGILGAARLAKYLDPEDMLRGHLSAALRESERLRGLRVPEVVVGRQSLVRLEGTRLLFLLLRPQAEFLEQNSLAPLRRYQLQQYRQHVDLLQLF